MLTFREFLESIGDYVNPNANLNNIKIEKYPGDIYAYFTAPSTTYPEGIPYEVDFKITNVSKFFGGNPARKFAISFYPSDEFRANKTQSDYGNGKYAQYYQQNNDEKYARLNLRPREVLGVFNLVSSAVMKVIREENPEVISWVPEDDNLGRIYVQLEKFITPYYNPNNQFGRGKTFVRKDMADKFSPVVRSTKPVQSPQPPQQGWFGRLSSTLGLR